MQASQTPIKAVNHASSMIVEDHMKKLLSLTKVNKWKFSNNKMLPKS